MRAVRRAILNELRYLEWMSYDDLRSRMERRGVDWDFLGYSSLHLLYTSGLVEWRGSELRRKVWERRSEVEQSPTWIAAWEKV